MKNDVQKMLDSFPKPITIITTGDKDRIAGMTAAWVTQVSWKPPIIGVAIYHSWYTLELIRRYGEFAIHLVSEDLVDVALEVFGSMSSRKVDKFEVAKLKVSPSRVVKAPIIKEAPIVCECKVLKIFEVGDHFLVLGKPLSVYKNNNKSTVVICRSNVYKIGDLIKVRRSKL